jgi:hypothetical protein
MAKNRRKITRRLSTSLVDIRVAQAAGMDLDENLARSRLRGLCMFNFPPTVGGGDDSCSQKKYQKFMSWFVFKTLRKHNAANFRAVGKKLYAPLDPCFNKSSRPGEIELVK